MEDFMKMLLFIFLGLIIAIMVLGYHKSPQAKLGASSPSTATFTSTPSTPYPSNKRNY